MIDVSSAATSGQLAPSSNRPDPNDDRLTGHFKHILAHELTASDSHAQTDEKVAGVESTDHSPIAGAKNAMELGANVSRLARTGALSSAIEGAITAKQELVADFQGKAATTIADPAAPAARALSATSLTSLQTQAAVFSLRTGPVLVAAVADGVTPVTDDHPEAADDASASEQAGVPDKAVTTEETLGAKPGEHQDVADADAARADIIVAIANPVPTAPSSLPTVPVVIAPGGEKAARAEQSKATASASSLAVHGVRSNLASADTPLLDNLGEAKSEALGGKALVSSGGTYVTAGINSQRSDVVLDAAAGAANSATASTIAFPAPISTSLAQLSTMATDTGALRHVERLYAPHDGSAASAFARLGTIGQDTGVALARGVADGRDHVTLRLDPPDLGRIDVQLSFGTDGGLRAVVASDNRAALDLLRRDLDQLHRALADAGVRADAQSFHFSERQSGSHQRWDAPAPRDQRFTNLAEPSSDLPVAIPTPRRLRASGLVDVFA